MQFGFTKTLHICAIALLGTFYTNVHVLASSSPAFYAITNKVEQNSVIGFKMGSDGKYVRIGEFETGGKGTGDLEVPDLKKDETNPLANGDDPLISAGSLAGNKDRSYLVAVNPGDGTISLMKMRDDFTLKSVNVAPASDKFPISVAVKGSMVVAASVGLSNAAGSISAFKISGGKLVPVQGSRRDLKARPSTIKFSSDGRYVIVNELVTGKIKIFAAENGNLSAEPVSMIDSPRDTSDRFQAIPVGFAVHGKSILMSEARFLTADFKFRADKDKVKLSPLYSWQTGSLSSYKLNDSGKISLVSGDALTGASIEGGQIANCWVAVSLDGTKVWAANALSSSISVFRVRENGTVTLINETAYKDASEMLFFSDIEISRDGKQIYQLVGNKGEVMILDIKENGDLEHKQTVSGLPKLGSYGLLVK